MEKSRRQIAVFGGGGSPGLSIIFHDDAGAEVGR